MHHLIKSMHKYFRETISNDGGFIYYFASIPLHVFFQYYTIVYFFLYFAIRSTFHFYHLDIYLTNNNREKN